MKRTGDIANRTSSTVLEPGDRISLARPRKVASLANLVACPVHVEVDFARAALVLVDMQNDFCHPDGWFARTGVDVSYANQIVPHLQPLLMSARQAEMPVVHLHWGVREDCLDMFPGHLAFSQRFGHRTGLGQTPPGGVGPALVQGSWGAQSISALSPEDTDIVVSKDRFSGFWNNPLDAILRRLDVTTLFFAGINTDRCVMATLQDASFLGYDVVLLEDAVATPSPPAVEQAALTLIRELYGFTCMTRDFIGR